MKTEMVKYMKRVLLINWDSYPNFPTGGVYTWAKNLIDNLSDWEIFVLNQLSNSNVNAMYKVPRQVRQVIEVPLFGSTRLEEYCGVGGPFVPKITRTNDRIIKDDFLPRFHSFLTNIIADRCDVNQITNSICNLRNFLTTHDSKKCVEHYGTWEVFRDVLSSDDIYREMELSEAVTTFRVLQRGLQVLAVPVPKVDLIHCSVAWVPSLIAVSEKIENQTPVIITEHGVAFRELLLYYNGYLYNDRSKVNLSLTRFKAALPSSSLLSLSFRSATTSPAISLGLLLLTKTPQPSKASLTPPTSEATIALPHAIASITANGNPSVIAVNNTRSPEL